MANQNHRNENGVKDSRNLYRNIKGVRFEHSTSNPEAFEEVKREAKSKGLKVRIINGELFTEAPVISCDCTHTQACAICAESKEIDWSVIEKAMQTDKPEDIAAATDEVAHLADEDIDPKKLAAKPAAIILVIMPQEPQSQIEKLQILFRCLASGDVNILETESGRYVAIQCKGFDEYKTATERTIESRLQYEIFGEFPLSEANIYDWKKMKDAFKFNN